MNFWKFKKQLIILLKNRLFKKKKMQIMYNKQYFKKIKRN